MPPSVEGISLAPWPFHPKTELIKGVLAEQCAILMKDFFKNKEVSKKDICVNLPIV